jgi:hypothetical protein
MFLNTSGSQNAAFGVFALQNNTTGWSNTAIGTAALQANQTGNNNTALGYGAYYYGIKGTANTVVGYAAMTGEPNSDAGIGNVAMGCWSLANTNGLSYQVAIGDSTLYNNLSGYGGNTAVGSFAMVATKGGSANTAIGFGALGANTSGNYNTALGYNALQSNVTGNSNTALGIDADIAAGYFVDATALGSEAIATSGFQVMVGDAEITSIGGQVGWTNFSDGRIKDNVQQNVPGLDFITRLNPVTYHFNTAKENELLGGRKKRYQEESNIEKMTFSGFIAQDVDATAQSIGYNFSGVDKQGAIWGLRYADFVPALVKSIQELKKQLDEKQQTGDAQRQINAQQQQQIDELKKEIEELKKK